MRLWRRISCHGFPVISQQGRNVALFFDSSVFSTSRILFGNVFISFGIRDSLFEDRLLLDGKVFARLYQTLDSNVDIRDIVIPSIPNMNTGASILGFAIWAIPMRQIRPRRSTPVSPTAFDGRFLCLSKSVEGILGAKTKKGRIEYKHDPITLPKNIVNNLDRVCKHLVK